MAAGVIKRVSVPITETTTKVITAPITETTSKRIAVAAAASNAGRVTTYGATPAIPGSLGLGTWGATWGGFISTAPVVADLDSSWGATWSTSTPAVDAVAGSPLASNTQRADVSALTAGTTKRIQVAV